LEYNTLYFLIMIQSFKDKKIKNLLRDICIEHHRIANLKDSNIGYLWDLYTYGSKKGHFRPFIFLAELNLLVKLNYLTEEEKQNLLNMLLSDDEDNAYLMAYSIITLRNKRIEDIGLWYPTSKPYEDIVYMEDIINPSMFSFNV